VFNECDHEASSTETIAWKRIEPPQEEATSLKRERNELRLMKDRV